MLKCFRLLLLELLITTGRVFHKRLPLRNREIRQSCALQTSGPHILTWFGHSIFAVWLSACTGPLKEQSLPQNTVGDIRVLCICTMQGISPLLQKLKAPCVRSKKKPHFRVYRILPLKHTTPPPLLCPAVESSFSLGRFYIFIQELGFPLPQLMPSLPLWNHLSILSPIIYLSKERPANVDIFMCLKKTPGTINSISKISVCICSISFKCP